MRKARESSLPAPFPCVDTTGSPEQKARLPESLDVMQGTLDLLILKALSLESVHGWGISARIQQMSHDVFTIGQGSLYPALHRFEKRGWVTSYWKTTENNRIARYYQLTAEGRHALADEIAAWRRYAGAVEGVITSES
jgi:PadR family transcriptional regulator, regulatory protein PadR